MEEAAPQEVGRMKTSAQRFLTQAEQELITEAVHRAENKTSGEIVPLITSSSGDYLSSRIVASLCLALLAGLPLTHLLGQSFWLGPQNMYLFLGLLIVLYPLFHFMFYNFRSLQRFFLIEKEVTRRVQDAALAAFYAEELYRTKKENGVLLYISLLEQRVWILADRGINDKLNPVIWQELVTHLTAELKKGNGCTGICHVIDRIGSILEEKFPYEQGDQNELHDLILR